MQRGKLNVTKTPQGWNCNSGCDPPDHCILPRCTNVAFPQTFSGSGTVGVLDLRSCDVVRVIPGRLLCTLTAKQLNLIMNPGNVKECTLLYPREYGSGLNPKFTPRQISEQVCKSEILVISFVQGNFNRVLKGREVRNVLFLVIP